MAKSEILIRTFRCPADSKDFAIVCDASTNFIKHYDFSHDPDTHELIVVEGKTEDRDAYIQTFKDEVGVYNILAKFSLTGDASLLNQREAIYADISGLPKDELGTGVAESLAADKLAQLNAALGTSLTADDLLGMSSEAIDKLINGVVAAHTTEQPQESEGE